MAVYSLTVSPAASNSTFGLSTDKSHGSRREPVISHASFSNDRDLCFADACPAGFDFADN